MVRYHSRYDTAKRNERNAGQLFIHDEMQMHANVCEERYALVQTHDFSNRAKVNNRCAGRDTINIMYACTCIVVVICVVCESMKIFLTSFT